MKYKKGCRVEVLRKKGMTLESWSPAEILEGNGHTYLVRYERSKSGDGQFFTERVPRKAIRPCPPLVVGADNWLPGDMVEVFDEYSWKKAEILKVIQVGRCFFVRTPGYPRGLKAYSSDIRIRQSWLDNRWIVVGKASSICGDEKCDRPSKRKCNEKLTHQESLPDIMEKLPLKKLAVKKGIDSIEFHKVLSRSVKKSSQLCSTYFELQPGACKKMRLVEKDGTHQGWPSQLLEKVDAVASPENILGDNCLLSSFNSRIPKSSDTGMKKKIRNMDERFLIMRGSESDDACSVASCSINRLGFCKPQKQVKYPSPSTDGYLVDTESSNVQYLDRKCIFPMEDGVAAEIHRLELNAYRTTMEALYTSGPLNWEQEAMMTNLRIELHISNDEHLLELKHLVSSKQTFL